MIGVSTNAGAMRLQSLHEFRQASDPGGGGQAAPVIKAGGPCQRTKWVDATSAATAPEGVERRERLVLRQQLVKPALVGSLSVLRLRAAATGSLDGLLTGQIVEFLRFFELRPPAIAGSPLLNICMTWKRSKTMAADGKPFCTAAI